MNREIKFRVWDKDYSKMHICGTNTHDAINFLENQACYYNQQNGCGSLPNGEGTYDLMQYTGLKDKNGVEIYEGDILHVFEDGHYGGEYYAPIEWVDYENDGEQWAFFGTVCLKVKEIIHYNPNVNTIFTRGFLTRRYGSCIELSEMTSRNYFIQVIGNIYQNPELLERGE